MVKHSIVIIKYISNIYSILRSKRSLSIVILVLLIIIILNKTTQLPWIILKLFNDPFISVITTQVLYCTIPYSTVLYCTVMYCTIPYCTVLYYIVLYSTVLYCTVSDPLTPGVIILL